MRLLLLLVVLGSLALAVAWAGVPTLAPSGGEELVFGSQGAGRGEFYKPRALAIGPDGLIYVADKGGRIQVFDDQGVFQRQWKTPQIQNGKPCGLSFDHAGRLVVADTHYFRVLRYRTDGVLLDDLTIGGVYGNGPGEFNFVTKAVEDSAGNLYVGEYGEHDRIQQFDAAGRFVREWGRHGYESGEFNRPQGLALDEQRNELWVADACNHRVQVFDLAANPPQVKQVWGEPGEAPGQLRYPYDIVLDGDTLYLCELGNHRIDKFTREGQWLESWGSAGDGVGQLTQPWAIARGPSGRLYVLDTYNHRVKRVRF